MPFCLHGGTALARGVGEKLQSQRPMPPCFLVVGKPGFSVATKDAFALYDNRPGGEPSTAAAVLKGLEEGDLAAIAGGLHNDLEAPVSRRYRLVGRLRTSLLDSGALGARMTGSGSAVFGIFEDREQAEAAAGRLRRLCRDVFVTVPLPERCWGKCEE